MVEWTNDPRLVNAGDTQVIRLEYTIAPADAFLRCIEDDDDDDDSGSDTLRLSAPWINYWKAQMPPTVTYSIQLPAATSSFGEQPTIVTVTPLPRNGGSSSLPATTPSLFSVTYDSEELWFCAGKGRCCGLEDTGTCAADPQPFLVDFRLPPRNDSNVTTSFCDGGTNANSGAAAATTGKRARGWMGPLVVLGAVFLGSRIL